MRKKRLIPLLELFSLLNYLGARLCFCTCAGPAATEDLLAFWKFALCVYLRPLRQCFCWPEALQDTHRSLGDCLRIRMRSQNLASSEQSLFHSFLLFTESEPVVAMVCSWHLGGSLSTGEQVGRQRPSTGQGSEPQKYPTAHEEKAQPNP